MNFLNLRYFVDIADSGSISAAARKNVIAQQSMSSQLKKLEAYYGTQLFYRNTPLTLTPSGEKLYYAARRVLRIHETVENEIRRSGAPGPQTLVIGLALNGTPPFMAELISQFKSRYQSEGVAIRVKQNCYAYEVLPSEVELLIATEYNRDGFEKTTLLDDRMAIAVSSALLDAVYGDRRPSIEREMLERGDPEILHELPFACYEGHTPPDKKQALAHGLKAYMAGESGGAMASDNLGLLAEMCRKAQYAVVQPLDLVLREYAPDEKVVCFPLNNAELAMTLSIYFRREQQLSRAAGLFIGVAKEFFNRPE